MNPQFLSVWSPNDEYSEKGTQINKNVSSGED